MELTDNYISVTDETILAFYRENKLDFIEMNHIFINILKNLSSNINCKFNPKNKETNEESTVPEQNIVVEVVQPVITEISTDKLKKSKKSK